jgi:hypothetical protein
MTTSAISGLVGTVGFAQEELFSRLADDEDVAGPFYALLKDEDEIEKVFGEFVVSATPPQ